jgi:hypothetical protein
MYELDIEEKRDELVSLLEEFLGEPRKHSESKYQISFDCPNCSYLKGVDYDGKGNLEVNYELGVYNCWSCAETDNTKGRLPGLFHKYASKETISKFYKGKFKFGSEFYTEDYFKVKEPSLTLPTEYIALSGKQKYQQFSQAFNYLYKRGITDDIITKHHIGFCMTGKYQNRIVIPSYDIDSNLNYFVTRSIQPRMKKFKYLNPDVDKTEIIFNEYLIDWDKPVFLVEGVFDHIVLPNSIPLLGKKLYDKLFSALYFKINKMLIILLDNDAYDDAVKIYNKLDSGRLYKKVAINKLPTDYDVSLFNEKHGINELKKWIIQKTIRLND